MLWVIVHLHCEAPSMSSEAFAEYEQIILPKHFRIHPAAFVSSHIINKYKRTSSTGSHTCPRHDTTTTMLHWWGGMLRIMSSSFPSPYSSLPSLWYKLILVSSVHRMLFQNCEGFFRCRLANSNLAFLFLRLTNGLHLVVNPLYSLWWSLLLIVDFDTHTPTSWRVFLIWPTVVKGVFFTRERILRSSTTVVFRGLPGLWCCWAHRCVPSF